VSTHKVEVIVAWTLLVGSLIGWPLSALTVARDEPQFVLGLSWLAITLTALDLLKTSRVHRDQTEGQPDSAEQDEAEPLA
jgi:uncharacterized membrane protein YfcA